jgi:hypothetical protein
MPDEPAITVGEVLRREIGHAQQTIAELQARRGDAPIEGTGWGAEVPLSIRLAVEIRLAEERQYLLTLLASLIADVEAVRPLPPSGWPN